MSRRVIELGPEHGDTAPWVQRYTLDQILSGMKLPAMTDKNAMLVPEEGWHCLHLFYRIEYGQ